MAKKNHRSPEEARAAILDAAEKVIVEVGTAGLRISAVAKGANMAHPNILHHFGSRDGLISVVAERVGNRATERITSAIARALTMIDGDQKQLIEALTHVLDTAYQGDEGRIAVWLHLSGAESSLKDNMQHIVELSHKLRKSLHPDVKLQNTNRLVMLVTLALVGEVVSGAAIKSAMGFGRDSDRAHFSQWLAEFLLNLSDQELQTSLS
ncbi:MAG: AcrR family transcriptional regulator [Cryomorphaceae bacterium]|jgi:AcrR family transcriptional regulator